MQMVAEHVEHSSDYRIDDDVIERIKPAERTGHWDVLGLAPFQVAEADMPRQAVRENPAPIAGEETADERTGQSHESGRMTRARQWLGSLATTGRHAKAGRLRRGAQAVNAAFRSTVDTANVQLGSAYAGMAERTQSNPDRRGYGRLYVVGGLALAAVVSRTHAIDLFGGAESDATSLADGYAGSFDMQSHGQSHIQLAAFESGPTVSAADIDITQTGGDTPTPWERFTAWVKESWSQTDATGNRSPLASAPDADDPLSTRVPVDVQASPEVALPDVAKTGPVIPPVAEAPQPDVVEAAPAPAPAVPAPAPPVHAPMPDLSPATADPLDTPPRSGQYLWNYMQENQIAPDADIMKELDQAARDMADDTGTTSVRWHGSGLHRWLSIDGHSDTKTLWQILRPYLHK